MDFTYGYIFGPIYRFHGIFGCLKGREVFSKTKKLVIKYRFIPVAVIMTQLFFKWANPGFFFHSSPSFQTNNTFFTTNQCEKMSIRSSKRCWDLIPRPLEHESLLITVEIYYLVWGLERRLKFLFACWKCNENIVWLYCLTSIVLCTARVTRWLENYLIFGHLQHWKFAQ